MYKKFSTLLILSFLTLCASNALAQDKKFDGMVLIPEGPFTMGLNLDQVKPIVDKLGGMAKYHDNAQPAHKALVRAFYIDKYEVTNKQYKEFVDATGHTPPEHWIGGKIPAGLDDHPVVNVTWDDASAYAKWKGKRLPTEAEWEKAARGSDGRIFPWGNDFDFKKANVDQDSSQTKPVGKYKNGTSPYGCFDMAGNVWEWTSDTYQPYPGNTWPDEFYGNDRYVVRGGSWYTETFDAMTTFRDKYTPKSSFDDVGFRCAANP